MWKNVTIGVVISFSLAGCTSYPDHKDGMTLTCWASKSFQGGEVNGNYEGIGNWINGSRESSVNLIRAFRNSPNTPFIEVIAAYPKPQPDFTYLELRVDGQVIRKLSKELAGQDDYAGGELKFEGRPYYRLSVKLASIYDISPNAQTAYMVAVKTDANGMSSDAARERIDLTGIDEKLAAIDGMIDESEDMRTNRRSECVYAHNEIMPFPEPAPW